MCQSEKLRTLHSEPELVDVGSYNVRVELLSIGQNKSLHQISNIAHFRPFLTSHMYMHNPENIINYGKAKSNSLIPN